MISFIDIFLAGTPFSVHIFRETVNLASQLESEGDMGRIQISYNTKTLLELTEFGGYTIMQRGNINIKGKGPIETFWLLDRKRIDDFNSFNYKIAPNSDY